MELLKTLVCVFYLNSILGESISTVKACGTTLTSSSGEIISDGYPSEYPNNLYCQWYIIAPSGQVIEITFLDVHLEVPDSNDECLDSVSVYDGTVESTLLSIPFCDDGPKWPRYPTKMLSTSNHMTVVMETNGIGTGRGIVANYKHVSPRTEMVAAVDTDNLQIFHFNRLAFTSTGKIPLTGSTSPSAISFDPVEEYFYFTDIGMRAFIGRVKLGGSNIDVLIDGGLQKPLGIAVGYLTGLLYWTDSNRSEVSVSRLDGHFRKTLVSANTGCVSPKDILLGPNEENVYWTCRGQIETSKADGSDRKIFFNNGVQDPRSLALDSETMTLFWTDAETHTLESIRLDGSNKKRLFEASVFSEMNGFSVDSHAFIWANPVQKKLYLVERVTSSPKFRNVWQSPPSSIEGIYYYNSGEEVQAPNACRISNGGCQELCFLGGIATICKEATPEIVDCPENIVKLTKGPEAVAWLEPSAYSRSSTESSPLSIKSRSHEPNDDFPLGITTVTYSFSDEKGNTNKCFFNVTLVNQTFTTTTLVNQTSNSPRGGVPVLKNILIGTFTGLLLLILLLTVFFMWYRCRRSKDEENDDGDQVGSEVDDYHTYYTISHTRVNDPSLYNEDSGNDERCLEGYTTRVDNPLSCDTISHTRVKDPSLYNEDSGNDKRCLVGYTTRVDGPLSCDTISSTRVNDPSLYNEDSGNDKGCLVGYTTRVDGPLSCDTISHTRVKDPSLYNEDSENDKRCLVGYTTRVDGPLSCDTISNTRVNDPSLYIEDSENDKRCLEGYTTRVDDPLSCDTISTIRINDPSLYNREL